MKIATLNYHNAYNYGAVFQAAALQEVISDLGHDCEIIDYYNPAIAAQYDLRPLCQGNIIKNIRANLVLLPFIKKKKQNFESWFATYKKTNKVDKNTIKSLANDFDKFVVGSDQVWNMKCQGNDSSYMLDFCDHKKRVAYAASFGTHDVKMSDRAEFMKYIPTFAHVSVREKRGIELVKSICGRDVIDTMDPVLLVGKEYWEKRMSDIKQDEEYIFVYQLGHGTLIPNYIKKLKKHLNKKVIFVTGHLGNMVHYSFGDCNCSSVSPEDFLSLLAHANYVVTNSFHATVLSMIFEKQFIVVEKGAGTVAYNSRIYNVLQDYGLEERITERFDKELTDVQVDYRVFNENIQMNREKSIEYLKEALGNC